MTQDYEITLSQAELLTVAGLLGFESIFGVDEDTVSDDPKVLLKQVHSAMNKQEKKKNLTLELDGTLRIDPRLQAAVSCLCNPETVALIEHNLKNRRKRVSYLLQNSSAAVSLWKDSDSNYRLRLLQNLRAETLLPSAILQASTGNIREQMLLEEAQKVRQSVESFDESGARQLLQLCLQDKSATEPVLQVLSGSCGYLSVRIVRRTPQLYKTVFHQLVALAENQLIRTYIDTNDVVFFKSADAEAFAGQLLSHFVNEVSNYG